MVINTGNLEKILKNYQIKNKDEFFSDNFEDANFIKKIFNKDYKNLLENINSNIVYNFELLSFLHLDRAIYELYNKKEEKVELSLSYVQAYSYILLTECPKACGCLDINPFLEMRRSGVLLNLQVLLSNENQIKESLEKLIDSLNAKSCLIRRGDELSLQAWFSIELLSRVYEIEIIKKRTKYPKNFELYSSILDKWDTKDLIEADTFVTFLCNNHFDIVKQRQPKRGRGSSLYIVGGGIQESSPEFLSLPFIQIAPYEVLAWLKIRELKGLENPKEFSHPIMNTKTVQMFLNIKQPLSKPDYLPYVDEVIKGIKQKCEEKRV